MIPIGTKLEPGTKVRYQPEHFTHAESQNGMVKEVRKDCPDAVWVVYHCDGQWKSYYLFTSAKTMLSDLKLGWR